MNKRYNTLTGASKVALTRCERWGFYIGEETYDSKSLLSLAEIHDAEMPADEDSFYMVSPGGAIGFAPEGDAIDWLFIPMDSTEELPETVDRIVPAKFCSKCGTPTEPGALFCGSCGEKL